MEERERCYSFILSRTPYEAPMLIISLLMSPLLEHRLFLWITIRRIIIIDLLMNCLLISFLLNVAGLCETSTVLSAETAETVQFICISFGIKYFLFLFFLTADTLATLPNTQKRVGRESEAATCSQRIWSALTIARMQLSRL
jgi:hypothetical protein